MTKSSVDGVGIAVTTIGGILIYGGIRGYSFLAIVANLITGKPITTNVSVTDPLSTPGDSLGEGTFSPHVAGGSPKAIGKQLASDMGWQGSQWTALEKLWDGESGWNPKAKNKSSGAYGIPQALPYSKMPKAAWPESAGGNSDATAQIQWGLNYIKGRYGTPGMAWAFWQRQSPHWY